MTIAGGDRKTSAHLALVHLALDTFKGFFLIVFHLDFIAVTSGLSQFYDSHPRYLDSAPKRSAPRPPYLYGRPVTL